jgi:hypothetical protein
MSWVEARPDLEWRWIQWIQIIIFGASLPLLVMIPETRDGVILRRKAARMRKEMRKQGGKKSTNASVESEYRARSEVDKPKLSDLVKVSLTRPICKPGGPQWYHFLTCPRKRAALHGTDRPLLQLVDLDGLGRVLRPYAKYTFNLPATIWL